MESGVITGIADSFCLSCHTYLKLKDVEKHIIDSAHQKTFASTSYVESYQEDRIRKVKVGYFCEICNLILQTKSKTRIHINEVAHVNNKSIQQLKDTDEGVVAFDDILIEQNAWQGLADGSCLICNVDYSNEEDHRKETSHILKLIQSKFELNKNKYVYRKVDENTFNCLTCNSLITAESKERHFNESEHKNKYLKCQNVKKHVISSDCPIHDKNNNETKKSTSKTNSENVIDTEGPMDKSQNKIVAYVNDSENSQIADTKDELLTPSEALNKALEFAKQNKLKYKRNGTYCKFCNIKFNSTLKMMKEHVAKSSHKEKSAIITKITINKVPTCIFVDESCTVKGISHWDFIINDVICISFFSFHLITTHLGKLRCQACNITLDSDTIEEHRYNIRHIKKMEPIPVIIDFKTEFVREVKPSVYHCGYCNFFENSLEGLKNHLKSFNHQEKKVAAQIRLQNHLPHIRAGRERNLFFELFSRFL
ncbi:uncharacterized protein LOC125073239 [Vanessa atalanta]|uniref:uncharacterized protein LOC125073239 n=1 Tax=Vanessa atalanta TaxID=42275 RepID=UPI001FCD7E9A|nr:uncharacterized protein LOC125073239 [Vanessa atalanta]XP_047539951.1 uncharacterized protein LOC125073239 [Vanessa atalanta]XP_047539952.1 uncharacterized protein LOC125073239 [Vanessa atalanta]XP_047539953.1 uncharacterized protein LOC125073239 [Vanessa atalanta]